MALFSLALCSLVHAQITFPVERPTLKVGDSWSYQRTDLWTNAKVDGNSELTVRSISDQTITLSGKGFNQSSFSNRRENLDGNPSPTVRGLPQLEAYRKFPLIDGESWEFKYLWVNGDFEGDASEKCKVKGTEKTTVPAGEFDTIKIVCEGYWTSTNGGGGSQENTIWYSPKIKRGVKFVFKSWQGSRLNTQRSDELVSYKLAP